METFSGLCDIAFCEQKIKIENKRLKSSWITKGFQRSSEIKKKLYEKWLKKETVMIYNTRKRSNDKAEVQKEKKICFNVPLHSGQSKIAGLNKMWPLKDLAMLNCESRTSLHAV